MANSLSDFDFDAFQFREVVARIETLIWLPAAIHDVEATPECFREQFVENLPDVEEHPLFRALPELIPFGMGLVYPEPDDVAEALIARNRTGFILQAATPMMKQFSGGGSTYNWGCYYTAWLYAPRLEDIPLVCSSWARLKAQQDKQTSSST